MVKKIILIAILALICAKSSFAQTQPNSISVTPSIVHIDLATDSPSYDITYQNNTNYDITLNLSVQDFTELEQGYKLNFLSGVDARNYKYSLSSWISFENPFVQLSPGEKKNVKIFIDKERITKGGHYASILAEVAAPQQNKNVNIKGVLSSLLFVRASTGLEIEEGKINTFSPIQQWIEFPDSFIFSFQNSGNVFVTPFGLVQIFDPRGKLVAKGIINEASSDVLPESIRRFNINILKLTNILLPGFYKANVFVHFGKTNQKLSQTITFFSYGSFNPVKILILMVILIIGLYFFRRMRKRFKR